MTWSCSDRWVLCKNISASHNVSFLKVSLKEQWAAILKTRSLFRLGYLCLNECEHTPPEEGKRALLSGYWWAVCLCSRPTDTSTLSLSHTVSAAVQGPARSSAAITTVSVLLRCVTLLCPLRVEGDWCFYIGPKHFSGVCKYICFRAMIMWQIWYGTPFVKVHKRLCALGRLMKQTCRAARITCALHLPQ